MEVRSYKLEYSVNTSKKLLNNPTSNFQPPKGENYEINRKQKNKRKNL